jgi:DNA-binding NarL/FixJ family response regulator
MDSMERTRIVLIDMPRLLREIVKQATSEFDVVAEYDGPADLTRAVDEHRAQIVIAGADAADVQAFERLVVLRPHVKVLGISADGRSTTLVELAPRRKELGELSPDRLRAAVHAAVGSDRFARGGAG